LLQDQYQLPWDSMETIEVQQRRLVRPKLSWWSSATDRTCGFGVATEQQFLEFGCRPFHEHDRELQTQSDGQFARDRFLPGPLWSNDQKASWVPDAAYNKIEGAVEEFRLSRPKRHAG